MGKDYYKILAIAKNASQEDIKKAYRKLALVIKLIFSLLYLINFTFKHQKWHPDRVPPDKKDAAQAKFQEISEAFECLSDLEKKKIYDQVGEEGLKGGMPSGGGESGNVPFSFGGGGGMPSGVGGMPGGGTFHFSSSNADDIFRNFFGTSDPFAASDESNPFGGGGGGHPFASFGGIGGMPGMGGGKRASSMNTPTQNSHHHQREHAKAAPINHSLSVSLEELYTGATKRMRITKKLLDNSGQQTQVAVDKEINVKQGWKDGTKITFEREGDEQPGVIPADIIFTIHAKAHDRFTRDGDDLLYKCPVTLNEALNGFKKTVLSLDNREIQIIETRPLTGDAMKIIPGEGMPNLKVSYHFIR